MSLSKPVHVQGSLCLPKQTCACSRKPVLMSKTQVEVQVVQGTQLPWQLSCLWQGPEIQGLIRDKPRHGLCGTHCQCGALPTEGVGMGLQSCRRRVALFIPLRCSTLTSVLNICVIHATNTPAPLHLVVAWGRAHCITHTRVKQTGRKSFTLPRQRTCPTLCPCTSYIQHHNAQAHTHTHARPHTHAHTHTHTRIHTRCLNGTSMPCTAAREGGPPIFVNVCVRAYTCLRVCAAA